MEKKHQLGLVFLLIYLPLWFLVGGFFSWGPLISYGIDPQPVHVAIILWFCLFFTGTLYFTTLAKTMAWALVVNVLVWVMVVGKVFYDMGP